MSERQSKSVQDRHERMLNEIVKNPSNEHCADCGAKNPRWASYSLGVFLCIRCAGIHRKMGTHISKVKSITMDQWTSEQIEMMRTSGGNIAVNSKINPNPGNNPRPLAQDDEHAMERYIRAKWEKRAFLAENNRMAPLPKTPISVPAVARLQALPKRSSSVPILAASTSNNSNNVLALNQLREMGFKDETKNQQILLQTQGSIEAAIEILSRSTVPSSSPSPAMAPQQQQFMTIDQKVEQLMKLGFVDRNSNMDALRRSGGNMDIAMTILNETKNTLQQQQHHQEPFRSNSVPVLGNQLLIDVDSTPATTTTTTTTTSAMSNPFAMQQQPLQIQYTMQQPQQQQSFMYQQQQQQQPQSIVQNNVFSNPFGLTATSTSTIATTANATTPNLSFNQASMVQQPIQQQQQQANFSNPFSQMTPMTSSPYTINNNTSYFMPTSTTQPQQQSFFNQQQPQPQPLFMQQQQPQQQYQYQQQQQTMNPWSSSAGTPNTLF
ncbi:THO2 plays a role in transcriptional elongation [Mucor velutinosus]|uniref:THO2 plays a role in transcriptional elongation n=1 Tax=Mucor velutinosus TaxID=708070 RepID=A0AAN7DNJ5_9FUNG|nr:THO2 plays a role in transcriptional elongation [Mucor velutinosus]